MVKATYKTNLNCGSCVAAVSPFLDQDESVKRWSVDTDSADKLLTVEAEELNEQSLDQHLRSAGFKLLERVENPGQSATDHAKHEHDDHERAGDTEKSSLQIYYPLLLVLGYLLGVVAIVEIVVGSFSWIRAMRIFMGGFFVAFSFFKLLDPSGFADAYRSYDILGRRSRTYGLLYPFLELGLGVAYLLALMPIVTNAVTLLVMGVGLVGVSDALLNKRRIQCACLGTVFDLPMSKVTFIEDGLMAIMAAGMLTYHLM